MPSHLFLSLPCFSLCLFGSLVSVMFFLVGVSKVLQVLIDAMLSVEAPIGCFPGPEACISKRFKKLWVFIKVLDLTWNEWVCLTARDLFF